MHAKKIAFLIAAAASLPVAAGNESARGAAARAHAAIASYEGTRTCAGCHAGQVKDVARSMHYQQQGPALFLAEGQQAENAGMMVSY